MKPCLFCLGSNCTICRLHIYSYSSCIWKGTQTHLRHMPLLHQEALPRTESWCETSLCTPFSLPGITNRAEGAQPRNSPSFKQLGAFKSSHIRESRQDCPSQCDTALPVQGFLPYSPFPPCSWFPSRLCCLMLLT